jgi:hypothetical protein
MSTSRAYHLPGVGLDPTELSSDSFVFRGPLVKRLSAEQFVDSVFALTSTWPAPDAGSMKVDGRGQGGQLGAIAPALAAAPPKPALARPPLQTAEWLWSSAKAREGVPPQTIYLRRVWSLEQKPDRAVATFTADNSFELFINGKSVGKSDNWNSPAQLDVTEALVTGKNIIGLKAANGGNSPNPAGAKKLVDYLLSPSVEQKLAVAGGYQIPLNPNVIAELAPALMPARSARPMRVDFAKAAALWDEVQTFLRNEFAR